MAKPEDIPQDAWDRARTVNAYIVNDAGNDVEIIARAILSAVEEERTRLEAILKDPTAVRLNYLRGGIACQPLIDAAVEEEREAILAMVDGYGATWAAESIALNIRNRKGA